MKPMYFLLLAALSFAGCEKDKQENACDQLPHTAAPAHMTGDWASGFSSYTQVIDVYTGRNLGSAWASGKLFHITADGTRAEFYYTAKSQFSSVATKAEGTIAFDPGSTHDEGAFTFHACSAHYKGWGTTTVDRDATADELKNNLTRKYYYRMEGNWLRIQPDSEPDAFSSSFELVH